MLVYGPEADKTTECNKRRAERRSHCETFFQKTLLTKVSIDLWHKIFLPNLLIFYFRRAVAAKLQFPFNRNAEGCSVFLYDSVIFGSSTDLQTHSRWSFCGRFHLKSFRRCRNTFVFDLKRTRQQYQRHSYISNSFVAVKLRSSTFPKSRRAQWSRPVELLKPQKLSSEVGARDSKRKPWDEIQMQKICFVCKWRWYLSTQRAVELCWYIFTRAKRRHGTDGRERESERKKNWNKSDKRRRGRSRIKEKRTLRWTMWSGVSGCRFAWRLYLHMVARLRLTEIRCVATRNDENWRRERVNVSLSTKLKYRLKCVWFVFMYENISECVTRIYSHWQNGSPLGLDISTIIIIIIEIDIE